MSATPVRIATARLGRAGEEAGEKEKAGEVKRGAPRVVRRRWVGVAVVGRDSSHSSRAWSEQVRVVCWYGSDSSRLPRWVPALTSSGTGGTGAGGSGEAAGVPAGAKACARV
ncbi:hypothetical protein GCM10010302_35650 [Streptomyces polychromogenes]|uniref:Uncharacterized protein n=1 Tax=Streptomyces polychromogenes TaxID=67342 RepID=A0ABP3F4W9_9ACTN